MKTILTVQNMYFSFPTERLFCDVTFSVYAKDRVAIIGANGTGKTTLVKLILNREIPDKGMVALSKGVSIGYLSQEVIQNEENTLYQEALLVFEPLIRLEKELEDMEKAIASQPDDVRLMEEYGKKQHFFQIRGGYDYPHLIEMFLTKFGFRKEEFDRKISTFSGGEKTKMSFAKLLLMKPELLILDEPTNHLDLSTVEWLEDYLKNYDGTLIFVSHDRYFINKLADKIFEIDDYRVNEYKGNYDFYVMEKRIRYEQQLKAYHQQQKEIAKMKRFIEFYMPKPRFVSRAKDRLNKLNRLKIIEKPTEEKTMKISFKGDSMLGKKMFGFEDMAIGYDPDHPLIVHINALVMGKDRLAIMGDNGTGKTTILKCILGEIQPLEGKILRYRDCNIGYVDQHHFDIKGEKTLVEYMTDLFPSMGEKAVCNHLGRFNFSDDDFYKTPDMLSGGEKMRLLLAKIILNDYDLLLLDEPTNHLDMITKQALIRALDDYEGTIIFVSHDRHFVDEMANKILYFCDGKAYFHEGNYQDFKEKEQELFSFEPVEKRNFIEEKKIEKREKKPISTGKLEIQISQIEKEIAELKKSQFNEEVYSDREKSEEVERKIEKLEEKLAALSEEYLERM